MSKIGALLEHEYALLSGVRVDVRFLQFELGSIRAAIHHYECLSENERNPEMRDWVDLFTIRVGAAARIRGNPSFRSQWWFRSTARKMATLPTRRAISSELHTLKVGVIDLTEQRRRHKIDVTLPAKAKHGDVVDPRLSALNQDIDRLVGLARPVEEVTKMVTESGDKSDLKTVSIVGMAGSGKTTLAYAVYMRLREENCFQCHAFVSVGQNLEVKKTLMDMLSMLADGPRVRLDVNIKKVHLIGRLREILEKKRYLIVVDDLWTEECCQIIKCCFPENSLGSRIITTTRKAALAAECSSSSSDCIYNIGLLSEVDSKKLAFDSWERFNGSNWFSLSHPGGEVMKRIFNLSYNDLTPHLSTCLLHLSIFPQNYEVEIDRLVRRWIAELYIVGARDRDVESIARSYLNELICRNMVQLSHLMHDDAPRCCKLHPVTHDFIVIKSMEENFGTVLNDQNPVLGLNPVRRLSIQSSKQDRYLMRNDSVNLCFFFKPNTICLVDRVRSVTVFGQSSSTPAPRLNLTDLSLVRVLDLEGWDGPVCLDGINNQPLLRYLSVRGTDISELLAIIWELRSLETPEPGDTHTLCQPSKHFNSTKVPFR